MADAANPRLGIYWKEPCLGYLTDGLFGLQPEDCISAVTAGRWAAAPRREGSPSHERATCHPRLPLAAEGVARGPHARLRRCLMPSLSSMFFAEPDFQGVGAAAGHVRESAQTLLQHRDVVLHAVLGSSVFVRVLRQTARHRLSRRKLVRTCICSTT